MPTRLLLRAGACASLLALLPAASCDIAHLVVPVSTQGQPFELTEDGVRLWTPGLENRPNQPDARASVRITNGGGGPITVDAVELLTGAGDAGAGHVIDQTAFDKTPALPAVLAKGESVLWQFGWHLDAPLETACRPQCTLVVRRHDASDKHETRIDLVNVDALARPGQPVAQ
jgi:hypothetical protein